jgi:ABC-type antimicrobial peptide transport system permease subunit
LSLKSALISEQSFQPDTSTQNIKEQILKVVGITDAGYVYQGEQVLEGLKAKYFLYDHCVSEIHHPVSKGSWFSGKADECIIGGSLTMLYSVGVTIILTIPAPVKNEVIPQFINKEYKIVGVLGKQQYVLNTYVGGSIDINRILQQYDNPIIVNNGDQYQNESFFSSMVIKYDTNKVTMEKLKENCAEYGKIYQFHDLYVRSRKQQLSDLWMKMPYIIIVFLITALISTSVILLSFHNNLKAYAVLYLFGEKRRQLLGYILINYVVLTLLSYFIALIFMKVPLFKTVFGGETTIVKEGYYISILMFSLIFAMNGFIIQHIFHKQPLKLYIYNR